jgi:aldose 1-epimerase
MDAGARQTVAQGPNGRFGVVVEQRAGEHFITLQDRTDLNQAILVPGLGFACIAFQVTTRQGDWHVLAEPPDDALLKQQATRYGIPILFPWPNRIKDGHFTFGGQEYQLPRPPGQQHASHGYARLWPWTVEQVGADDDRAFCRASVSLGQHDGDAWPFPTHLIVEYSLSSAEGGAKLSLRAEATNIGAQMMPMGFGLHPWFPLPLGPDGDRDACEIRVPADSYWVLDDLITTGERRPISQAFDARAWRPLGGVHLDDVYTGLALEDGWFAAQVRDPSSGRQISVRSDAAFREHVVFAPPNRSTLCLEPYTCPTDAFNLQARGIDAGVVVLDPGERWVGRVEIVATA